VQSVHFVLINVCISATEYHLGLLKAKLAKYRSQLLEPPKKSEKGEGFDVLKSGDARVALIGFPSVGKVRYVGQHISVISLTQLIFTSPPYKNHHTLF
jgi:ribosome-interacting GTPase 1